MSQRNSVRLSDVATQGQYGLNAAAMKEGQGVRFVRITDIDERCELRSDGAACVPASTENLASYILEPGDLLIARSGATAGKSLLFRGLDEPAVFAGYLIRFKLDTSKALPDYVGYFFKSSIYWNYINTTKRAAAQPNINAKELASLPIPLPPLPEQRRIVDLLSRAEGIVRLRREAEKKAAELIPALFLDMFGDPATNPKGWPIQSLKNLVSFVSGGTPSKSREDFWEGDLPWVSPKDMKRVGIDSAFDHVNRKVLTETAIKLIPVGSVLVVVRGMILVHTVPVAQSLVPMTINQDMKALVPIQSVNGTYLLWSLRVRQGQLLSLVTTAAHGTKKMETERLEAFSISLPPLAAQEDFAGKLASIESIQSQQSAATAKAQATFDALLAQALAAD